MANREEILADFQACTGIEDVEEAICHLEDTNWNLMDAVYRVLPHEGGNGVAAPVVSEPDVEFLGDGDTPQNNLARAATPPIITFPSFSRGTSGPPPFSNPFLPLSTPSRDQRILNFRIEYNGREIELKVRENESIATIKRLIFDETGVPPHQQELTGWGSKRPSRDSISLDQLQLPRDNFLYLAVQGSSVETSSHTDEPASKTNQTYQLHIHDETTNSLRIINFPGSKTVREVKQGVCDVTGIPVRHQYWSGWPPRASDEMTLATAGLNFPIHNLSVNRIVKETNKPVEHETAVEVISDDSSDDFEDAIMEDDIFLHDATPSRPPPLMPDGIEDEALAAIHFAEGFASRYGPCHPMFFQGSLDDAMKDSVLQSAKNRKLLAVYLHHDGSVSSNVFCTQVLCSESVVSFLSSNFVIWGWDLTGAANRAKLLAMIQRHFDSVAASSLRSVDVDRLPLMLIVTRSRATNEVLTVIEGSVNVDEMMTQLVHAVDMFSEQQRVEIGEEEERDAREQVKREQDEAYEASLRADRAKEEAKRQEEREKQRQEEESRRIAQQEEEERLSAERKKEELKKIVQDRLPAEPGASTSEPTSTIRFRMPDGSTVTRRFLAVETLQVLLDYLFVQGWPSTEYKVLSSWPRKDLTALDTSKSLRELNLFPQETLIVEQR